ncbi:uncharacterized protein LOC134342844 isoform X2 [Mobula hypostoma]|uniref:uncharacterized protein LOC134342844 isoform X2 n=1 Tax=Mobula hypostoma TaxID=723540 RepID=UPI002FC3ACB5
MEVRVAGENMSSESEPVGSDPPAEGSGNPGSEPPAEGSGNPGSERAGSEPPVEGSESLRSDPSADRSRSLGLESLALRSPQSDLPVGSNDSLGSDSVAGGSGSSELNPSAGRRGILGSHPPAGKMQSWVVQQDAQMLSASLKVDPCREAKELTESIEEMLIRLDEFCGMLDMIRNDSSQILDESIPKLKVKALEMKKIFVKMVEQSATMLEEQVIQAEKDSGNVSRGVCRFLHSINAPFLNPIRMVELGESSGESWGDRRSREVAIGFDPTGRRACNSTLRDEEAQDEKFYR